MFRQAAVVVVLALSLRLAAAVQPVGKEKETVAAHKEPVNAVACSDGDRLYATASDDGTAIVWDANTRKIKATLHGHEGPVLGVAFSPNGKLVATAGADKTVRIWDAES